MSDTPLYTVGGTVQAGGGVYLARRADPEMLELCRAGTFAFVLTARQMGKSSLMVRTAEQLYEEGIRSVIIDLTRIGKQVTADQWYVGLLVVLQEQLELSTDVTDWWGLHRDQGPVQRMTRFLEEVVLSEVKQRVVVFVDEIDTTLGMGFTDDFYAAIRYLYNARAGNPELERLSFVLVGVATPGDLIQDEKRTPFNLGQRVELTDFTLEEAAPLAEGLGSSPEEGRRVLEWVLSWTGGHPYLTQRLCQALVDHHAQRTGGGAWTLEGVREVVERTFFAEKSFQDNNLVFVRDMLTRRAPEPERVLRTYQDIRRGRRVLDEERVLVKAHLKLSGVVRREGEVLRVRNAIYERVFTVAWARTQLPVDWRVVRLAALGLVITGFAVLLPLSVLLFMRLADAERNRKAVVEELGKARETNAKAEANMLSVQQDAERIRAQAQEDAAQAKQDAQRLQKDALQAKDEADRFRRDAQRLKGEASLALEKKELAELEISHARTQAEQKLNEAASYVFVNQANATLLGASSALPVSTALSLEAARIHPSAEAMDSLIRGLVQLRQPQARLAHEDNVLAVAFSPAAGLVITASEDKKARLWDAATGRERAVLPHDSPVTAAAFNPDGTLVATASDNGHVRLWNTADGKKLPTAFGHGVSINAVAFSINAVAFSPDGKSLATGSDDNTARLWSTATGQPLSEPLRQHLRRVNAVAFSPDGKLLATASTDRTVRLWKTSNGELQPGHLLHPQAVNAVAFSPDGTLVATASDDRSARLWEVATRLPRSVVLSHDKAVMSVAFSPDGKRLATASSDKTARLWEVETGRPLVFLPHDKAVNGVAFSPDGKRVATASDDKMARLWEVAPRPPLVLLPHEKAVTATAFSPDGRTVVTASEDNAARLWRVDKGEPVARPLRHDARIRAVAFSPEGTRVATASEDKTARLWSASTGASLASLPHGGKVLAVAFSPDGGSLLTASEDKTARLWDAATGRQRALLSHDSAVNAVAFSPEGGSVATASHDGTARLWNAATGELQAGPLRHGASILAVVFSPEGTRVATASEDNTVRLWDRATGESLGEPLKHDFFVTSLAFSPDGRSLVTASEDISARVWDVATGEQRLLLPHANTVTAVAFSPDGTRVATASEDESARLWDAATGRRLAHLPHTSRVLSVAFSPDGTRVATASGDGTARVWPVRPEDWSQVACSLLPRNLTPQEWPADVAVVVPYRKTCPGLP
ncbi:AAA-like domain-containing protein [Archangium gephyra]|uniref:AAA-like domain-containing protein n=1 Tax=Archangium gephyra TaxID=48 RepID=UPI001471A87D|nr:AAA-like domain-containing protein [Archangium gephyra]